MTIPMEMLGAYVDGELGEAERRPVEAAIARDADLAAQVERMRALRDRLAAHYGPVADEPAPDRFAGLLEAGGTAESGNVVRLAAARARRSSGLRRPGWVEAGAIAATLLLGIALGRFGSGPPGGDVVGRHGILVARGALARSLDTQLASSPSAGAPVRIGVSFLDAGDHLCRSFTRPAMAGIACRRGGDWMLMTATATGPDQDDRAYRQAGSANPAIMQAAQAMMKGDPLDAVDERRALRAIANSR